MMQGRRHCRPLHDKARAMACGGNPRALPDFRPSSRGRQRRRQALRTCGLSRSEPPKDPAMLGSGAQNDRFGPDVVTFGVNPSQKKKNDPKQPKIATSGPNPGSGPEILSLADVVVFLGCFGWVNINFDGFL